MKNFSRLPVLAALTVVFLLAFLFGGPENIVDVTMIRQSLGIRIALPEVTAAMIALTHTGSAYATLGLGGVVSAWLWLRGQRGRAYLLGIMVVGERLVMDGLKLLVGRPRPSIDAHPVATHSSSFPSGHATNTMAVFVAVALFAAPAAYRRPAVIAAVAMSLLVGSTRPYLGVHWPSDVIGGWSLGLIAVWIAVHSGVKSGVLPVEPQHDIVGRHGAEVGKDEAA
jgi:undecaprenyl-diphosphatase